MAFGKAVVVRIISETNNWHCRGRMSFCRRTLSIATVDLGCSEEQTDA